VAVAIPAIAVPVISVPVVAVPAAASPAPATVPAATAPTAASVTSKRGIGRPRQYRKSSQRERDGRIPSMPHSCSSFAPKNETPLGRDAFGRAPVQIPNSFANGVPITDVLEPRNRLTGVAL